MRRTRFDEWQCSVARTADLLGDWWTPLVLREAFFGSRRFDDFVEILGISRNTLTERLARLVEEGILAKQAYQENPTRCEYTLTEKGRALFGVLASMIRWGDDWLATEDGPPVELVDLSTGEVVHPMVVDERTGKPLDHRSLRARPGPGMSEAEQARFEERRALRRHGPSAPAPRFSDA
jgi:DNA-binding HxlR family transcriptional regulator